MCSLVNFNELTEMLRYHATIQLMFTANKNSRQAIVVLPAGKNGQIADESQRRWLARSSLQDADSPREMFDRVLSAADIAMPEEGLAALRLWGQTGDRPNVWIAAADLIHLEPRLGHLCLHALRGEASPGAELRALFDHLQDSVGDNSGFAFARVGKYGYLRGDQEIATAAISASVLDGMVPDEYMPAGENAAAYLTLTSELQMSLHEHEVNARRDSNGMKPINSVWLWGGGRAPERTVRVLPPLFGEDPLFQGFWASCTGVIAPWPGNFSECLEFAVRDFVVLTPENEADALANYLDELRGLLQDGQLDRLILLFRDGLTARIGRFDAFRFWRRTSGLL
jgi:hypothetical protein